MTRDSKRTPKAKQRDRDRAAARKAKQWLATRAEHVAIYGGAR